MSFIKGIKLGMKTKNIIFLSLIILGIGIYYIYSNFSSNNKDVVNKVSADTFDET